jgi:hypothetical protein
VASPTRSPPCRRRARQSRSWSSERRGEDSPETAAAPPRRFRSRPARRTLPSTDRRRSSPVDGGVSADVSTTVAVDEARKPKTGRGQTSPSRQSDTRRDGRRPRFRSGRWLLLKARERAVDLLREPTSRPHGPPAPTPPAAVPPVASAPVDPLTHRWTPTAPPER